MFTLFGVAAAKCSAQCAPDVELRSAVVEHMGASGIWFHREVAACLLEDVSELRLVRERVTLLEARLVLSDESIALAAERNAIADEALTKARDVIATLSNESERATVRVRRWRWLSLAFTCVGIVAGSLVTVYALGR